MAANVFHNYLLVLNVTWHEERIILQYKVMVIAKGSPGKKLYKWFENFIMVGYISVLW